MNRSESPMVSTMRVYSAACGELATKPSSQYSGWCRSAKPPSISARMKLMVRPERS